MDTNSNPRALPHGLSVASRGLSMIALVLALILALLPTCGYAYSSSDQASSDNTESVSAKPSITDDPAQAKICSRCGEENADTPRCKNCGLKLRTSPGRYIPYGLNSRTRYDLNGIERSNQRIDRSMRSLQKSLRDMNTSINRIRMPSRRF